MSAENNKSEKDGIIIDFSKGIAGFLFKIIIFFVLCYLTILSLVSLIPDIPKIPETEKNKLILLSFIQNPYVLIRLAQLEEDKGNLNKAVTYTEAAIGLLEMHGASEKVLDKYNQKIINLKKKEIK